MKNLIFILMLAGVTQIFAQGTGSINGRVFDDTGYPMQNASVYIDKGSEKIGTITDENGFFSLKFLSQGYYKLNIRYIGYQPVIINDLYVRSGKITTINNVKMTEGIELGTATVQAENIIKLIDPDEPSVITTRGPELEKMSDSRNLPKMILNLSTEIKSSENGKDIVIRGSRPGSSSYYVDGVKISDLSNVPGMGIASLSIYTGGIPAKYGDLTGGVVVVETKTYFDMVYENEARERRAKELEEAENNPLFFEK
ncbi:MAG: carboxypeptidase regulatory-like domain-containing protein [Bacteroidota bacterium]